VCARVPGGIVPAFFVDATGDAAQESRMTRRSRGHSARQEEKEPACRNIRETGIGHANAPTWS
jgi:hypothetical protein